MAKPRLEISSSLIRCYVPFLRPSVHSTWTLTNAAENQLSASAAVAFGDPQGRKGHMHWNGQFSCLCRVGMRRPPDFTLASNSRLFKKPRNPPKKGRICRIQVKPHPTQPHRTESEL